MKRLWYLKFLGKFDIFVVSRDLIQQEATLPINCLSTAILVTALFVLGSYELSFISINEAF